MLLKRIAGAYILGDRAYFFVWGSLQLLIGYTDHETGLPSQYVMCQNILL